LYFDKTRLSIDKALSLFRRQLPKGDNDMKNIKYFDGKKTIDIAVNEETAQAYQEIKRAEWRQEKSKQRHEQFSLETLSEAGMQFIDEKSNIEEQLILKEEQVERRKLLILLQEAVASLQPSQRKMIKMAFYENKSYVEIGQFFGISKQSAYERMQTILKKLKIFYKKP